MRSGFWSTFDNYYKYVLKFLPFVDRGMVDGLGEVAISVVCLLQSQLLGTVVG